MKLRLIALLLLIGLGGNAQTTAWSTTTVTSQTRKLLGANQIRWLWGSNNVLSWPDSSNQYFIQNQTAGIQTGPGFRIGGTGEINIGALGTSITPVFSIINPTAATNVLNQNTGFIHWGAPGWGGSSQMVDFYAGLVTTSGSAAPGGEWQLYSSINGGGPNLALQVSAFGTLGFTNFIAGHGEFTGGVDAFSGTAYSLNSHNTLYQTADNDVAVSGYFGAAFVANSGLQTVTVSNGGALYTNGTYTNVPIIDLTTGNHTTAATALATVVISGGAVSTITIPTTHGARYSAGDNLTVAVSNIGGTGSGLVAAANTLHTYTGGTFLDIYAAGHVQFPGLQTITAVSGLGVDASGNVGAVTLGGGSVASVSGTTNRVTSTGGTDPVIDISSTFEALLEKVSNKTATSSSSTTTYPNWLGVTNAIAATQIYFAAGVFNGAGTSGSPFTNNYDSAPTSGSSLGVTSNGVYSALQNRVSVVAPQLTLSSTTGYVWTAIDGSGDGSWQAGGGSGLPLSFPSNQSIATNGYTFTVSGNSSGAGGAAAGLIFNDPSHTSNKNYFGFITSGTAFGQIILGSAAGNYFQTGAGTLSFYVNNTSAPGAVPNGTDALDIDATGLASFLGPQTRFANGILASASSQITGTLTVSPGGGGIYMTSTYTGANFSYQKISNGGGNTYFGQSNSTGAGFFTGSGSNPSNYEMALSTDAVDLGFGTSVTERMRNYAASGHWVMQNGGTYADDGVNELQITGSAAITSAQTTVNGSTSGTAKFTEPFQGATYKRVLVYCAALLGTAAYTFPTAFTNTPVVITTSGPAASVVTSLSSSGMTITGATTTGVIIIEGY